MKKHKKLFAIVTLVCFLFTLMPVAAFATIDVQMTSIKKAEVTTSSMMVLSTRTSDDMYCVESGTFCDNLIWSLDGQGVLIISGSGSMELDVLPPWYSYLEEINNIVIEDGVTSIGFCAFSACSNLTSITISGSVTSIGSGAFEGCESLTEIDIPENVTEIASDAFNGCEQLTIYGYADSYAEIFANENNIPFVDVNPGAPVEDTTSGTFCDNLVWSVDGQGVLTISGSGPMELDELPPWYHHLDEINNIIIENGVTSIGLCAFYACSNLTGITIPDSITSIGNSAFEGCENLTRIDIPANVTEIASDAFHGCERLTIYGYANSHAESYANENNIPFITKNASGTFLGTLGNNIVWTLDNNGTLTISGSGKMEIEELPSWYALKDEIKQAVIKNGVTSIGKCAFLMCGNLTSVSMPESITEIGLGAFYDCDGLTAIDCPDSLRAINDDAFSYCSNLMGVTIPKNVTVIGESAFSECTELTIYGVPGSYAETYAKNNRIPFSTIMRYTSPLKKDGEFKFASDLNKGDIWYKYSYDETLFFNDSAIYQHDLVKISIRAALAAFGTGDNGKAKNIETFMEDLEFHNIEANYPTPEVDSIGYAIGSKNIQSIDGEKCALLMVAVRGGAYGAEWGGNFELGWEETHRGFNKAANKVLNGIETYIAEHENELNSNIKVWIMGYSRGAATSNLVAKNLIDGKIDSVKPKNVFAFCFECPQNTKDGEKSNIKYNRIVNIVNPIDLVPKVAMSDWGYGRYGTTYYTPYKDGVIALKYKEQHAHMKDVYENILRPYRNDEINADKLIPDSKLFPALKGDFLANRLAVCFRDPEFFYMYHQSDVMYLAAKYLGENKNQSSISSIDAVDDFFTEVLELIHAEHSAVVVGLTYLLGYADDIAHIAKAHYGELCLAWIDSLSGEYEYANSKYRIVFVNCPVDIKVYDSTDNIVGSIVNDTIEDVEDGVVSFMDYNGQKMIALPCDEEYSIQLTATDNGTVTYTVTEFNLDSNSTEKLIGYHEVDIIAGDQLIGVIENLDTQSEAEYLLYKNNNDKPLQVSVSQIGSSVEEYQVNVTTSGYGMAYGGGNYIIGEFAKVSAEANEGNTFLGWYADGELITDEPEYRFLVKEDVLLTAVFTEKNIESSDSNSSGNISYAVSANNVVKSKVIVPDNAVPADVSVTVKNIDYNTLNTVKAFAAKDDNLAVIGGRDSAARIVVKPENAVTSFIYPVQLTVPISKSALNDVEDVNKLSLALVTTDEQGNTVLEYVGGNYDAENGTFTAYTGKPGNYVLVEKQDIVKMDLFIGNLASNINGEIVMNDVAAYIANDRTMVPVSFIMNHLGCKVDWFGDERKVVITLPDGEQLSMIIDQPIPDFGAVPVIVNDRTMVPVAYIAYAMDAYVLWVEDEQRVIIVK